MKISITMIILFFSFNNAFASNYQLGFILGAPTGVSAKVNLENKRSIDAALAYSLADDLGLEFHVDYLFEKVNSFPSNMGAPLDLYYGIGARFVSIRKGRHDGDTAIGPRFPVGLTYQFGKPNLELFAEVALAFDVIPSTNLDLEGGIGLRFKF